MFHFQNTVTDWPRAVAALPPGSLVKAVDRGDILRDAKQVNRAVFTNLRHWYDHGQHFGGSYADNVDRARKFFASFIDDTFKEKYAKHTDSVGEFNEYLASSHTGAELADRVRWARAAAEVWANEYRTRLAYKHIRLSLCATAVGNDIHPDFFHIAREYDCIMDYHPYTYWARGQRAANDWADLSGRWVRMEQRAGVKVDWLFGEAGPFESAVTGWRSAACLGSNQAAYVTAVREWLHDVQQTAAYREGRIKGFALFTTSGDWGGTFRGFETVQPEMDALAAMIAEEWAPGTSTPPPPPEPEPQPGGRVTMQRAFNIRTKPTTAGDRIGRGWRGLSLEDGGLVDGTPWRGDGRWRKVIVYIHEQGFE